MSLLSFIIVHPASAATVLDFSGGDAEDPIGDAIGGWEFQVTSQITVDALGVWDEGGDGLDHSHDVGLWTIDQTLLAQTTVLGGSFSVASSSGLGDWVFNNISSLALSPGTYVLGATFMDKDPDPARVRTSAATIPEVMFINSRQETNQSTLAFPTIVGFRNDGIFGPNIHTVPLPAAVYLFGSVLVGLAGIGYRRRRLVA